MGRPSKYREEYAEQVKRLALLGLKEDEIASVFEVDPATVTRWKQAHDAFRTSLKEGRAEADAKVAESLYKQALDGNVTAMIFWLKNRQSALWRDKPEPAEDEHVPPPQVVEVRVTDGRANTD